ncbi:hypothetical protein PSTG_09062 [Puccinia striiformis f. sp. tritici PST-78]|nr:hypothetical protein PSTG_09062 [Puccinia striiformis f. sp. tritici PST-78]
MKMSPKQFITGFLTKNNSLLRYRRCMWTTKYGRTSTIKLVRIITNNFRKTQEGSAQWTRLIQEEAISILQEQLIPKGCYPLGSFQSARTVTREFFTDNAIDEQNKRLTTEDTPFLFNLLVGALSGAVDEETELDEELDKNLDQYIELPPETHASSGTSGSEDSPDNSAKDPEDALLTDSMDED